jgi:spore maturation protein CgeB
MIWYELGTYMELATPDYHYVSFKTDEEFLDKLERYSKDKKARLEIAKNARNLILSKNTYQHRIKEILSYV